MRHMLHIVPQKRPTAPQILRHSWLWQVDNRHANVNLQSNSMAFDGLYHHHHYPQHHLQQQHHHLPAHNQINVHHEQTAVLRGAVNATFRAIASPQAANVGPVGMSELARRRAKDKVTHTHLWDAVSPMARKRERGTDPDTAGFCHSMAATNEEDEE